MSKSFALAAAEAAGFDVDEKLPFQVEGDETQLYAYLPGEGQVVMLMGVAGLDEYDTPGIAAASAEVMNVFWELMDDQSRAHLRRRLRDRHDRFGLGDILNIIEWLVEEASARPTRSPSDSTPSPQANGRPSTGSVRQRASTRSPSPRTASAT